MILTIEPIPMSTWGISLASRLDKEEWDEIRHKVYKNARYRCQVCGAIDTKLHCHEVWKFDDRRRIQKLFGFLCLCKLCHDVKHFGRSIEVEGKDYVEKLIEHWCRMNKKSKSAFYIYQRKIFELNKKRSEKFYMVKVGGRVLT